MSADAYVSKPTECQAVRWGTASGPATWGDGAEEIVEWVKDSGGDAKYIPNGLHGPYRPGATPYGPRIAIRTINGWAHAEPGHYVVMGSATFDDGGVLSDVGEVTTWRDFYPCDPKTFERRWQPRA